MRNRSTPLSGFVTLLAVLALAGCGGGGGSLPTPDTPTPTPPPPAQMATVTVLITDAPSDLFDQINVTIISMQLLGGNQDVVLFEGEETVDLLALENFADLFVIADEVPAGTYSKIRLSISDLELVRLDDQGNVEESVHPDLPANGKIDLNPRGDITLAPGDDLLMQIDIDAARSIHIVGTGNGRYRFRPVVFVGFPDDEPRDKPARVHGEIVAIDEANGTLEICQARPTASARDDVDDRRHCVIVIVDDQTGLFGPDANGIGFADLAVGEPATVIGLFTRDGDALRLDATVVALGSRGTFERFEGTVETVPDADDIFGFALDPRQGFAAGTVLGVALQAGTGIADEAGQPLDATAVQPGVEAEVEGLLVLSDVDRDLIRAIYVALDSDDDDMDDDDEIRLSGTVLTVDPANASLTLATDGGDRCVVLGERSRVFLITSSSDASDTMAIDLAEVPVDAHADAYGREAVDGCFRAAVVLVLADN